LSRIAFHLWTRGDSGYQPLGTDVVASGNGTLNLAGLPGGGSAFNAGSLIWPNLGIIETGEAGSALFAIGAINGINVITGPASFGSGSATKPIRARPESLPRVLSQGDEGGQSTGPDRIHPSSPHILPTMPNSWLAG
jgi:hypothetical protein